MLGSEWFVICAFPGWPSVHRAFLRNGLASKQYPARGSVVDCLLGGRKRCTDVDLWLRGPPGEAMAKLARIYEACAEVAAAIGSCKNLLVTRTTYSVTILTSDRSIAPVQVDLLFNLPCG